LAASGTSAGVAPEQGSLEMLCNAAEAVVQVGGRVYVFGWSNSTLTGDAHLSFGSWRELLRSVTFDPAGATN